MGWAESFSQTLGKDVSIQFRAFDGSRSGDTNAETAIDIRSPLALSHFASAPGELGLARAYVSGSLEVLGDMYTALSSLSRGVITNLSAKTTATFLPALAGYRLWWPVGAPTQEFHPRGWRHSKNRDQKSVAYHYDVSNQFYEWVLGPSMTYTCAVFPRSDSTLEQAQFEKHDVVARKLGLSPGMRMLDVGCGWGGMVMHAAQHYGVRALGVTLSHRQAQWAQKVIAERGLADLAEVRYLDYRDVPESSFDSVSSIGLTEHIGRSRLGSYFSFLNSRLRPGGRLLNHCITRPDNGAKARAGKFISRYVFPDGELESPGTVLAAMHDHGFEARHVENWREHYAMTLARWCANLERHWEEAVREVGAERARIWRLYMAASRLGFEYNNIQLHQFLGVRLDGADARMPLRPEW